MVLLFESNDPVRLSWAQSVLSEAGIVCLVLDQHTSAIAGGIGAIQRRLMVSADDLAPARLALARASSELPDGTGDI